ncbi:DnaD domain protein [Periweissella cryptocerci]|uniref:DnaD domain protein n=1 Tax=Periweissella cryptocerci TaxID=2506420 RepID=A0A4P6YVK0_9LACO|nr:DnaD domain protein [Periweissella cryptocerci]QBO36818.1 DnaD domain protein [Periweissella cryptocerci]
MDQPKIEEYIHAGETTVNNYLLLRYAELGMTNEQFLIYLQAKRILDQGGTFPDLQAIANTLHLTQNTVANDLNGLIQQGLAELTNSKNANGQTIEKLSFDGLIRRLLDLPQTELPVTTAAISAPGSKNARQEVFATVESEFRRPLSSFELQTVGKWLDEEHFTPEMILLALKEAVLNGVYNFKYIQQILVNWQQNNIRTAAEVERHRSERKLQMGKNNNQKNGKPQIRIHEIPLVDIFHPENN